MTDTTPTPTTETHRKPELSVIVSSVRSAFTVRAVDGDEELGDRARVRIDFGESCLFIQRRDIPALVNALILA